MNRLVGNGLMSPILWGTITFISLISVGGIWWYQHHLSRLEAANDVCHSIESIQVVDPDDALELAFSLKEIAIELGSKPLMARAYFWIATLQRDQDRFGQYYSFSSSDLLETAAYLVEEDEDVFWRLRIELRDISIRSMRLREMAKPERRAFFQRVDSALEVLAHQIASLTSPDEKELLSGMLVNTRAALISQVFSNNSDSLGKSIQSLQIWLEASHSVSLVRNKVWRIKGDLEAQRAQLGILPESFRDSLYQASISSLEIALAGFEEMSDSLGMAGTLGSLGKTYLSQYGNWQSQEKFYRSVGYLMKRVDEFSDFGDMAETYRLLGKIYHWGNFYKIPLTGRADSARKYYELAIRESIREANLDVLNYSVRYWKTFLKPQEQQKIDSVYQVALAEFPQKVSAITARSSRDLFQNQLRLEQQEAEGKRTWMLTVFFFVLLGIGLFLFIIYQAIKLRHFKQDLEKNIRLAQVKMNPHFIGNFLNAIDGVINGEHPDLVQVSDYLVQFSRLTNAIMSSSEKERITLAKEIEILRSYLRLERLRLNHRFEFHIDVGEGILPDSIMLPPMLLQPFIENAVWHGLQPKIGEDESLGQLSIQFFATPGKTGLLHCRIQDNGIGREKARELQNAGSANRAREERSRATEITVDRLRMLGVHKQQAVVIEDLSEGAGTIVTLTIPIVPRKENATKTTAK